MSISAFLFHYGGGECLLSTFLPIMVVWMEGVHHIAFYGNRHEAPTSPSRGSPAIQLGMS